MTQTLDLSVLFADAAAQRGLVLSRQELWRFAPLPITELVDKLRQMLRHQDECRGGGSHEILGQDSAVDLGHAPAWIDSGTIYEELVTCLNSKGPVDTVFCLDPWVAQLRSRALEIAPDAKWILVSDLAKRKLGGDRQYWDQMESWIDSLSFSVVIPKEEWDAAIALENGKHEIIHLEKPGAWQWRRILPSTPDSILFLVRYSGSLMHLRVFLDSLARQVGRKRSLHCALLLGQGGEDPGIYLRWFGLAHPEISISSNRTTNELSWKAQVNQQLALAPGATLVLTGDHAILPDRFVRTVSESPKSSIDGIQLSVEASAHIVTGNLDPIPNYESLLRAFSEKSQEVKPECARILAPDSWRTGEGDYASRILSLTQGASSRAKSPLMPLLQLADLP